MNGAVCALQAGIITSNNTAVTYTIPRALIISQLAALPSSSLELTLSLRDESGGCHNRLMDQVVPNQVHRQGG
jgi:hypothetical protein